MTAPAGVVDLSLPDYPTLIAAAGVNPDEEAARVAGANPADVAGVGAAFGRAGGELDAAWSQSMGARASIGAAFVNDGAPVLDEATHVRNLPPEFREAGTRLAGASTRLGAVADELTATMTDTSTAVTGLHGDLAGIRSQWAARVAAAGTLEGGLIPEAAIPGLLAERDRRAADMATRVGDTGRRVTERIRGYEVVLNGALRLLADQGFVPPAELDAPPPPAPRLEGTADPTGFGTPLMAGYAADPVNTALGNFVEVEPDLPFGGLLAGLSVRRTYNSRSDRIGPFGPRWSSWASTRLTDRTWTADYEGPDGQRASFPRSGSGFARAAGIAALVLRRPDGLSLAWFDGRRWDFDQAGRPLRAWAGPGTGVAFRHDDAGRLIELVHDRGRRVLIDWDPDPDRARIVAVSASDGRTVRYRYDEAGQLVTADTPAGARNCGIDPAGLVASVTDADGVVELVNTYDARGRVLTQRSPFGRLVTFDYLPDGATVVADDSAGPRNTYRHDRAGRLIAATDGHGHTQHKRYDAWGNPIEIVERGGAITRQEFDQRGHLVRRALASGAVYRVDWDEADRVTAITVTGSETATAVTRFGYSGIERSPSEIVDAEGGITRLTVADGLVTSIVDPDGVLLRLRHDPDGHLVEVVDAAGGVARIERDPAGVATAVTTPAGRRTELRHDARGLLVERRDPAGGVWRREYTAAGRLAVTIDPTGARTETRYGPHGEAAELVDALGAVTTRRYDAFGNLADVTAPDGAKWAFTYDALSRLTAWTDPAGGAWLHEHDADGHLVATLDPSGVRRAAGYDHSGRITRTEDGLAASSYRYDDLGRVTAQVLADGTAIGAGYDRCGRRTEVVGPDGGRTRYHYTPAGRLARVVSPAGREQRFDYDGCGRLITRTDGNGRHWQLRYDPDGLLREQISPSGLVETILRDPAGRVARRRVPGRGTTRLEHDLAGRVVAVSDRDGCREFGYDPAGRVCTATDALGHTTHYTWNERGHLCAVTDPLGARTRRRHDELGRVTARTDPLGRIIRFRYDAAGRLIEQTDPADVRQLIDYDPAGRSVRVGALGPDGRGGPVITIERDPLGQPVRIAETDASGRAAAAPVELRRDANGRLVERRAGDRALGWSYDADGLRSGLTYPDGSHTGYHRDGAGRVIALEHSELGTVALDRDPDGRLLAVRGPGIDHRYHYTEGWLTGYDDGSRRTRLTRDGDGRVLAVEADGQRRLYDYDPAGQLIGAAGPDGHRGYDYDPAGRLVTETGPDGPRGYRYDAAGQLRLVTEPTGERVLDYDPVGRRCSERYPAGRRSYHWDDLGRLTGVSTTVGERSRSTTWHVDALGELAAVDDLPLSWDTADPNLPLVAIGDRAVVGHGYPLALAGAGGRTPLELDWQHTVQAGAPATDPWGAAAAGRHQLGWRGELVVDGVVWLRHRGYDPATRGFLQPDPLPAIAGTAVAGHPYHYAGNDPVNALDPLGLRPVTDADLAGQRDDDGGGFWSDLGHGALDLVGMVPVVGEAADLANAAWYTAEGDYLMAGLSAAAAVPFLGWGATGAKLAVKGGRALEAATDVGKVARRELSLGSRSAGEIVDGAAAGVDPGSIVYRADTRGPEEIFAQGFQPKGSNLDLAQHVYQNPPDSGFVSTSKSLNSAQDFAGDIGAQHVYKAHASGHDVNAYFGSSSPFPWENEIAVPGPIPPTSIEGAWGPGGWIPNPGFGR